MKFSRVISRVRWFSLVETDVSKTISVLVLWVHIERIVKEGIHIRLKRKNFNRDNGLNLNRSWFPITRMLASQKAKTGKESSDLTGKHPVANVRPRKRSFDRYK
jgi:hypothetical protein